MANLVTFLIALTASTFISGALEASTNQPVPTLGDACVALRGYQICNGDIAYESSAEIGRVSSLTTSLFKLSDEGQEERLGRERIWLYSIDRQSRNQTVGSPALNELAVTRDIQDKPTCAQRRDKSKVCVGQKFKNDYGEQVSVLAVYIDSASFFGKGETVEQMVVIKDPHETRYYSVESLRPLQNRELPTIVPTRRPKPPVPTQPAPPTNNAPRPQEEVQGGEMASAGGTPSSAASVPAVDNAQSGAARSQTRSAARAATEKRIAEAEPYTWREIMELFTKRPVQTPPSPPAADQ
jgi:hypothetical protein